MKIYRVEKLPLYHFSPYRATGWRVIHDNASDAIAHCPTRSAAERVAAALNAAAKREKADKETAPCQ